MYAGSLTTTKVRHGNEKRAMRPYRLPRSSKNAGIRANGSGKSARNVSKRPGPGILRCVDALPTGNFDTTTLRDKPRDDLLTMVALNFDNAVFTRTARTAMSFEGFRDVLDLIEREAVNKTHGTCTPPFAGDANDAIVGQRRLRRSLHRFGGFARRVPTALRAVDEFSIVTGHQTLLRQARASHLRNGATMARLCVFCGSHSGNDDRYATIARATAQAIVAAGFGVVFGGGRVGLMGVLADAALAAGGEVVGVIPEALASEEVAHAGVTQLHIVDTMHTRKALMADLSDGFIALPGGYGTMDEFCEILTWRQLRIHDKPIGLLNMNGYYDALLALFDRMLDEGFIRPQNRELFTSAATIDMLIERMRDGIRAAREEVQP